MEEASLRNRNEFGVTAVAIFSDHLGGGAKLLVASPAERTGPAGNEIVNTNAIARFEVFDAVSDSLDHPCDFMTEREWQSRNR